MRSKFPSTAVVCLGSVSLPLFRTCVIPQIRTFLLWGEGLTVAQLNQPTEHLLGVKSRLLSAPSLYATFARVLDDCWAQIFAWRSPHSSVVCSLWVGRLYALSYSRFAGIFVSRERQKKKGKCCTWLKCIKAFIEYKVPLKAWLDLHNLAIETTHIFHYS